MSSHHLPCTRNLSPTGTKFRVEVVTQGVRLIPIEDTNVPQTLLASVTTFHGWMCPTPWTTHVITGDNDRTVEIPVRSLTIDLSS